MKLTVLLLLLIFLSSPVYATDWTQDPEAIATYTFDETSGDLLDQSNSLDGTPSVGVVQGATGQFDDAYTFTQDAVPITGLQLADKADFTISGWFNTSAETSNMGIWGDRKAVADHVLIRVNNQAGKLDMSVDMSTTDKLIGGTNLNDGEWHHYAGISNNGSLELYIDGSSVDTGSVSGIGGGNQTESSFGHIGTASAVQPFFGDIDEHGFFSDVKDSTDINDIMDNGLFQVAAADRRVIFIN